MSAYCDKVIADGATAYWRLNETSGTTAIDVIGGNNGTISGGVTLNQSGATVDGDRAMAFNGSTGDIAVADNAALGFAGDFTVEAWINATPNAEVDGRIISKRNASSIGYELYVDSATGNVSFFIGAEAPRTITFTGVNYLNNAWHHVVGVRSGSNAIIYIDG